MPPDLDVAAPRHLQDVWGRDADVPGEDRGADRCGQFDLSSADGADADARDNAEDSLCLWNPLQQRLERLCLAVGLDSHDRGHDDGAEIGRGLFLFQREVPLGGPAADDGPGHRRLLGVLAGAVRRASVAPRRDFGRDLLGRFSRPRALLGDIFCRFQILGNEEFVARPEDAAPLDRRQARDAAGRRRRGRLHGCVLLGLFLGLFAVVVFVFVAVCEMERPDPTARLADDHVIADLERPPRHQHVRARPEVSIKDRVDDDALGAAVRRDLGRPQVQHFRHCRKSGLQFVKTCSLRRRHRYHRSVPTLVLADQAVLHQFVRDALFGLHEFVCGELVRFRDGDDHCSLPLRRKF
mmetsp:Transcript_12735/g.42516  ORF Transcript_12735/g.42516 Transcript_12735/m.42516 type:complete len:352 (-) Transcript_12735:1165-2220(-)